MTRINLKKPQFCLAAALLWIVLCVIATPVYTTVTLSFQDDPEGEVITTVYAGPQAHVVPSDARSRVVTSAVARISYLDFRLGNRCSLKRIDPVDQDYQGGPLTLTGMTVRQNGILTLYLNEADLRAYFTGNDQVQFTEDTGFTFLVTGEDPQLIPNEAFRNMYAGFHLPVLLAAILFFGAAGLCLYALILWFLKETRVDTRFQRTLKILFLAGILGALLLCAYTGLRSPFWLNPDEYEVKAAVGYYFTGLMPPDIRSDAIVGSFSVYGTSRHFEWNLFYLCAGKLGRYFTDPAVQIRLFSLLLFGALAGLLIRNIRRQPAYLFLLLLTPQVWYLFSYATSDGLDFFLSFLAIRELIEEKSMLNRLLREPYQRRHLWYYALLPLLFVQLLWAKISFYPILVFLFLILLVRLLCLDKKEQKDVFLKCLILLGLTLGLFLIRYLITDYPYYGIHKAAAMEQVTELRAQYAYKPSTPVMERAGSLNLKGKGVTLTELLTGYDFHKNLFCTFAGFFGTYTFGERDWYYLVMGILYGALLAYTAFRLIRTRERRHLWELAVSGFCFVLQYALVVYRSWTMDFQPQGRYLFPVLFFTVYLISRIPGFKKDKFLWGILTCTCLLSLYAFLHVGVPNLVPHQVHLP